MGFAGLVLIALVALAITSFTGSVAIGTAGVAALAGALVLGITVGCHKAAARAREVEGYDLLCMAPRVAAVART